MLISRYFAIMYNTTNVIQQVAVVLEMFTKSFDASTKTSVPLFYCGIDDALIEFFPRHNGAFLQLTDVLHVMFVNFLLHHQPDFVICWIKFRTLRWPWYGRKSRSSFVNISSVSHARCTGALSWHQCKAKCVCWQWVAHWLSCCSQSLTFSNIS